MARQIADFKRVFATVDLKAANHVNLTAYDVLTIASMVERETAVASERPLVAAVIYNRLRAGMPLQIIGKRLNEVGASQRINSVGHAGLIADNLLGTQGDARGLFSG